MLKNWDIINTEPQLAVDYGQILLSRQTTTFLLPIKPFNLAELSPKLSINLTKLPSCPKFYLSTKENPNLIYSFEVLLPPSMSSFTWSRSRFLSPNVTLTITARRKLKRSLSWATTLYNITLTNFENVLATSQISTSVDPRTPWGSSFCPRSWLTIQTKFQLRINRVLIRLCLSKMPKSSVKASSRMLISILFNNILFVVWRWIKKFSQRWEMPEFCHFFTFPAK